MTLIFAAWRRLECASRVEPAGLVLRVLGAPWAAEVIERDSASWQAIIELSSDTGSFSLVVALALALSLPVALYFLLLWPKLPYVLACSKRAPRKTPVFSIVIFPDRRDCRAYRPCRPVITLSFAFSRADIVFWVSDPSTARSSVSSVALTVLLRLGRTRRSRPTRNAEPKMTLTRVSPMK